MSEEQFDFPWQYSFAPFFTLQPHAETRARQIKVWRNIVLEYFRSTKQCVIDVREGSHTIPFSNTQINRKLNEDFILAILSDLQRTQNAAPLDKQCNRWEIYWRTLDELSKITYDYICSRGATNSVLTIYELINGEDAVDEEFYGLDSDVIIKALRILESSGKCELMLFDEQQGVKFF